MIGANLNDKSMVMQSVSGMEGATTPFMQPVFTGNGANVPQMQAIPTSPVSQQSPNIPTQQPSTTSSSQSDK